MNKTQRYFLERYWNSNDVTLDDVYSRVSSAKRQAYKHCMFMMEKMNGSHPRITSYNTFNFTFAFLYEKEGKNWLYYMTSTNDYTFPIE